MPSARTTKPFDDFAFNASVSAVDSSGSAAASHLARRRASVNARTTVAVSPFTVLVTESS